MEDSGQTVIDLSFLNSMTSGNKEKITKYINMFLQLSPGLIAQMGVNVQQEDWSGLKTTAHTLKSQLSYMGANSAKALALEIEKNADEKMELDQLPEKVKKLTSIFNQVESELKMQINNL
jgi:HPt (histidine-containing phosphotransfer) domain-containing protein